MAGKLSKLSGFPEWLPEEKLIEEELCSRVRSVYESHGFTPIETPSVELMETLVSKGVEGKELYALTRYGSEQESELGLHFDLTVPFARYVALHLNDLDFPFRRYQLQKVWRGERPQKGRFREFYQFDADVVARDELPLSCDAEMLSLFVKALQASGVGSFSVKVNNRKILMGAFERLGVQSDQFSELTTIIDKREKIGDEATRELLSAVRGLDQQGIDSLIEVASFSVPASELEKLNSLLTDSELARQGVAELLEVLSLVPESLKAGIEVNCGLARGLDYYTGIIIEGVFDEYPEFGSVGGGGRYDGLVSQYLKYSVPGVGVSLGVTRIMDLVLRHELFPKTVKSRSQLLVTVLKEEDRSYCNELAESLRSQGVRVEVFFKSPKLGKQIDYASKKGIPYVLFYQEDHKSFQLKDIENGKQEQYQELSQLGAALVSD